MLIGACGAGGTGKTTTMQALAAAIKMPFIPSASRAVFERRGIKESDQNNMTPQQQWELQQEIFAARESLEAKTIEGIADRTLFDQVAYNLLRAPSVISQEMLAGLVNRAKTATARYDHVFFFPLVTFDTADDGMRDTSYGLRYNFNAILVDLLESSKQKVHVLPVLPITDRVNYIKFKMGI